MSTSPDLDISESVRCVGGGSGPRNDAPPDGNNITTFFSLNVEVYVC